MKTGEAGEIFIFFYSYFQDCLMSRFFFSNLSFKWEDFKVNMDILNSSYLFSKKKKERRINGTGNLKATDVLEVWLLPWVRHLGEFYRFMELRWKLMVSQKSRGLTAVWSPSFGNHCPFPCLSGLSPLLCGWQQPLLRTLGNLVKDECLNVLCDEGRNLANKG